MTAPNGFIDGYTNLIDDVADRLDPAGAGAGKAAADEVGASALDCGKPLPSCLRFNAAVREATAQFSAYFTQVEQGVVDLVSVAHTSATGYRDADGTAKAGFPMNVKKG